MIFNGSAVALCTPFTDNGINFDTLGRLIDFQIQEGTDVILVCGTTGEPSTMTNEEKCAVIDYSVKRVGNRVPLMAGVGGNNTAACVESAKRAKECGANGILAVTPYYNKCNTNGVIAHFNAIADATDLPVTLYNVPARTCVNINPEGLARLMEHKNIVAVKEASGDITQIAGYAAVARGKKFAVYSGCDDHIVPLLSVGGQGVVSVLANIMPRYTHDMVMAYLDGDVDKARDMQLDVNPLVDVLFCEVNPIPVKTALGLMGYDMGPLRLPLCEIDPDHKEELIGQLRAFKLIG